MDPVQQAQKSRIDALSGEPSCLVSEGSPPGSGPSGLGVLQRLRMLEPGAALLPCRQIAVPVLWEGLRELRSFGSAPEGQA